MDYYIHCPLPKELAERVLSIEKKYQGDSRSRPHLTIIRPQGISAGVSERELIGSIRFALRKQKPFFITQLGVGYFGKKEIICIRVKRSRGAYALPSETYKGDQWTTRWFTR